MPQDLARVSWGSQKIKGGAESPGGKTIWRGRGFARQRDCPLVGGGRGPTLKTQRGRNSVRNGLWLASKVRLQSKRMWLGLET